MPRGVKGSGPARRGTRVALSESARAPEVAEHYVTVAKPVLVGEVRITKAGVEVPGAKDWPRIEAWVNARLVRPVTEGEQFTPFEEYAASVKE